MTTSTTYPLSKNLRYTLERYILDLYEVDGSTLKDYTNWPGYYTLPNRSRIPAVFVIGSKLVPSNWNITGIEMTIDEVPEDIRDPGSIGGVISFEFWRVRFTNYGTQEGTVMPISMLDIRRRIARAFPRDRTQYQSRTEATYEGLTVSILGPTINPPIP